nr:response regulator transcription factor [Actinokineospora xionganensis]
MNTPVRVLVVDDDPLVRAGLVMILSAAPDLVLVGEAADGTEVVAAVDACAPDVVLMDIRMPRLDGLAATELLRARSDPPEVIVLTTFHADEYVLRALRAGASGFLLKDTRPTEILHAITRVAAGDPILSPAVTRRLIAHVGARARTHGGATPLRSWPGSANGNARSRWRWPRESRTRRSATSCS